MSQCPHCGRSFRDESKGDVVPDLQSFAMREPFSERHGLADNIEYRYNSSKTESGSGRVMVIYHHELPVILAALRGVAQAAQVGTQREALARALCCPGGCMRGANDCVAQTRRELGPHRIDQIDAITAIFAASPVPSTD